MLLKRHRQNRLSNIIKSFLISQLEEPIGQLDRALKRANEILNDFKFL
jgi:hypothetical protein